MKKLFFFFVIIGSIISCKSKQPAILSSSSNPVGTSNQYEPFFDVTDFSENKGYGITEKNPIMVGGFTEGGVINQRRYIASLAGPNNEELSFHRRGACCPYPSENSFGGNALVDVYEVTYEGIKEPILLYISLYDSEKLFIPQGFTKRK